MFKTHAANEGRRQSAPSLNRIFRFFGFIEQHGRSYVFNDRFAIRQIRQQINGLTGLSGHN